MLKGNRTRLFGVAISILGLVETYAREIIPADYQGYVLFATGVMIIILRQITTTVPGQKQ